ncbi:MAG: restriction endonuclease subunit S, partial [Ruminococcus sp.]|nr:restriction endonuclease subunit S [Ruminococcus sp.]
MKFKENIVYTIRNYSDCEIKNKTLKYGDLLIEKSGGGDKTPVGRTVVYRLPYNAIFANFMDCIRLKSEYNVEYIKYIMFALYNKGVTNFYFTQTTGLQNLNMAKFFRENIVIPPLEEQEKISAYLDRKCTEI